MSKTNIDYIEYKDRKFALASKGDRKSVLFLPTENDLNRLKKAKINPFFDFKGQNKKILDEFLNDEDFCTIIKMKLFGFDKKHNMFGYSVDVETFLMYNCVCMINNFIE